MQVPARRIKPAGQEVQMRLLEVMPFTIVEVKSQARQFTRHEVQEPKLRTEPKAQEVQVVLVEAIPAMVVVVKLQARQFAGHCTGAGSRLADPAMSIQVPARRL